MTAQELTTAATTLRDSHRLDGETLDLDNAELGELLISLLRVRDPLANWLESWNHTDVQDDGPLAHDYRVAIHIAQAFNGTAL